MDEETKSIHETLLGICERNASSLISQSIHIRNLQSELDALRVLVRVVACRTQLSVEVYEYFLSALTAAFEQRQLEALEDQNPAAAAMADTRQGIPDLDPEIMEMIRRACEGG